MPESKLREIADAADMIVSGFAFNKNGEMMKTKDCTLVAKMI